MFHHDPGSRSPHTRPRPHVAFPFRTPRRLTRRQLLLSALLLIVVLSGVIGGWSSGVFSSHAAGPLPSAPASMTFQQFLKKGTHQQVKRSGPPAPYPQPPRRTSKQLATTSSFPSSAEPATMQPINQPLSASFLAGSPGEQPLDLKGSDGRLEVQLQPGSLDLSQATVTGGAAPAGGLSLQLSQLHGHFEGMLNLLGYYQVQVVDSQGQVVNGITVHTPLTFLYHYQPAEMLSMNLDPGQILMSWPSLIAAAQQAKQPTTGMVIPMHNDPATHTLTGQSLILAAGTFGFGGDPQNQLAPIPHQAEVQGNNGQLSSSYPLKVPPGIDGFAPHVELTYSSLGPNDRHNTTSPAGDEGDGWSLTLGSITQDVYATSSWYFINGIDNVGDRLIYNGTTALYYTEHLSYLRIQQVTSSQTNQPCFDVWDRSGTFYELGCTMDSLQYSIDSNQVRHNYQWDVDRILAPNDGGQPSPVKYKLILVSYLQDCNPAPPGYPPTYSYPCPGSSTIRDAVIKQISYGYNDGSNGITTLTATAGTVDFQYLAPFTYTDNGVAWATAYPYGGSYSCTPLATTSLRCDDPIQKSGGFPAPSVEGTFSLQTVTSYVGSDGSASNTAYRYSFTYADSSFQTCNDPVTGTSGYCAGEHLLTGITPSVYQNGTAHPLKGSALSYRALSNTYYDSLHNGANSQPFQNTTTWQYLTDIQDLDTGMGEHVSYARAYNNSDGTPTVFNGTTVIDDRYDALYCTYRATDCSTSSYSGHYAHPDDNAWSVQVVTQLTSWGEDSSALGQATTTFNYYRLAQTGTYQSGAWCYPDQVQQENACVGDNWFNSADQDWGNYFHAEFRGFAQVWQLSPAGDLTIDYYFSTEGWNKPATDPGNYNAGQLQLEERYQGGNYDATKLLSSTLNTYPGPYAGNGDYPGTAIVNPTTCYTPSGSAPYAACDLVLLSSQTKEYNATNSSSPPFVEHDYSYDDYDTTTGLKSGYHNLLQDKISGSNLSSTLYPLSRNWAYTPNDQTYQGWTYYTVDKATHSDTTDASGHLWQCQDIAYDEGSGAFQAPSAGWPTTVQTYSNSACTPSRGTPLTTSYLGYDAFGNVVASVDGVAAANSPLYSSNGCTLATTPAVKTTAWSQSHYTTCTVYDSYNAQPATVTNALGQASSITYDYTQGALPTSTKDLNNQTTSTSYSYDGSGNRTVQVTLPLHSGSYTSQSSTASSCTSNSVTPCFEIDSKSYRYNTVFESTFYDSLGRAVETRTPGPGSGYDTLVITTYNDQAHSVWQSVPFEITHGSGWVDPNGVTDYQGTAPGGTVTFYDALGRPLATRDPLFGSAQEPGITCSATLSGNYTACSNYNLGSVSGDTNTYATVTTVDPNKHVRISYLDALGRTVYVQVDSGRYGSGPTVNERENLQYNVLDELTSFKVIDKAPLSGQTITTATTTAQYDDLGRLTQLVDPDRGTHSYTYDADGRVLTDVSGTRTIGTNYDLLGRLGCVQDAAPTINATGACSAGNPYVQNTYDTSKLTVSGTTDYPIGRLTQSVATTYYPGGDVAAVTESFEHDARGRLQAAQLQFPTLPSSWGVTHALPSYLAQYTYNDADQVTTTATSTTPSGQGYTTTQVYDTTIGSLYGVSNNGTTTPNLATLVYNARAQLDTINFQTTTGSALAADQFGYDANLRPTSASATWQPGSGSSGTVFSQNLSYDPASNVISLATTQAAVPGQSGSGGSESQNFCYDEQNRLVWAGNSGTQPGAGNGTCGTATLSNTLSGANYNNSYVYTHLGQLWQGPLAGSGTQQQYLYCNSQPHELTGLYPLGTTCANLSGAVYSSSYDSWGNVTSRTYSGTTATLSYDLLDHFVKWNVSSTNKELYIYDASGTRVLRRSVTSSGTTMTVYAFGLEEHRYGGAGVHQSDLYYYTLGGRLLGASDGTNTTFYLTDALGSVLASFSNVANSAAIQGNQVFGPYGNARDSQGTINTAKGFTGQYNDSLTGLDYYGSRYYDQVAGVFLSADVKQGNMQGMNPYAYVGGNPETRNDPSGQRFVMPVGGGGSSSSSIIQAVNAVVPTSTAAQGGSQPCRDIGCASSVLARLEYLAAVHHVMNSNLAMLVCGEFCFTAVGEGQSSSTTYYRGETGIPETYCPPPFQCSVERAQNGGDTGVNGHDMPDVAAADTGGGAAGNPGGETSDTGGETPPVEPGQWIPVNEHMPARAAQYQTQITGREPGWAYVVDGVNFDGYLNGTLLEAKGPGYDRFLTPNGEFLDWFSGEDALLNQARNQVRVAGGVPIEWHVAELRAYNAISRLLVDYQSIQVIHTPFLP